MPVKASLRKSTISTTSGNNSTHEIDLSAAGSNLSICQKVQAGKFRFITLNSEVVQRPASGTASGFVTIKLCADINAKSIKLFNLLPRLLANRLLRDAKNLEGIFNQQTPAFSEVELFTDSFKGKDKAYQAHELSKLGLIFANDWQAMTVCAAIVKKAKDIGLDLRRFSDNKIELMEKLSEGEYYFLNYLSIGYLRTETGMLGLLSGELRWKVENNSFDQIFALAAK